jgi:collagenase-like PrtC family protease
VRTTSPTNNSKGSPARFTLGFNFDPELARGVLDLNRNATAGVIDEVFAALPDCPLASARPTAKIPRVEWGEFARLVRDLDRGGVGFNYLMNTRQRLGRTTREAADAYVRRLRKVGVARFTAGSAEICRMLKSLDPSLHVTISITRGIRNLKRLREAEEAGADAVYLDGVFVNRDFPLLRELRAASSIEVRLYANMSCVAGCPVVEQHYGIFAGPQDATTARRSDAYFAGCSVIKLRSAVEWVQMPWIRPEDIPGYRDEGIGMFKLADRLAPTPVLLRIAETYLSGSSPPDLFELMERNAAKYGGLAAVNAAPGGAPIVVHSDRIPADFVEHFRSGLCRSRDLGCPVCNRVAAAAVEIDSEWAEVEPSAAMTAEMPRPLLRRAGLA